MRSSAPGPNRPVPDHRSSAGRLRAVLVVAALLLIAGCTGAESEPDAEPSVRTLHLDLVDSSRTTDPTPGRSGDETAGRQLPTDIWYSAAPGRHPIVVFSHGVNGRPDQYRTLLSGWAAAGFVVVTPTFPLTSVGSAGVLADLANQPKDVSFVLNQVLARDTTPGDPLEGRLTTDRVAAAGHSGGAVTTLGLVSTCCADARVRAAIVMSGTLELFGNSYVSPGVPMFFLHGTADETVPLAQGEAAYAAAPGPKAGLQLIDGSHSGPFQDSSDPAFGTVLATTTDFLRWSLDGDAGALDRLRSDAAKTGAGELTGDTLPG